MKYDYLQYCTIVKWNGYKKTMMFRNYTLFLQLEGYVIGDQSVSFS